MVFFLGLVYYPESIRIENNIEYSSLFRSSNAVIESFVFPFIFFFIDWFCGVGKTITWIEENKKMSEQLEFKGKRKQSKKKHFFLLDAKQKMLILHLPSDIFIFSSMRLNARRKKPVAKTIALEFRIAIELI